MSGMVSILCQLSRAIPLVNPSIHSGLTEGEKEFHNLSDGHVKYNLSEVRPTNSRLCIVCAQVLLLCQIADTNVKNKPKCSLFRQKS